MTRPSRRLSVASILPNAVALLRRLALLAASAYLLILLVVAALRLGYPYELEWIEGANLRQTLWMLEGHFPYRPPHINFLPLSYTPFYFLLSAGLMKLLGIGFFAPRLLSLLSALGCCLLLYSIVKDETGNRPAGLLAAGLYAACYRFSGAWMDLAKVDSLFLFLFLLAFWVGLRSSRPLAWILSAGLYVLAYYTKQLALPALLVLAPSSLLITKGKTSLKWLLVFGGGSLLFYGLDRFSQGWFTFYTFTTVAHHPRLADWWLFWRGFLPQTWPAFLIAAPFLVQTLRQTHLSRREWPERSWLLLALAAGLFASSWSIYLKVYTWDNDRMPACLALALLASLSLAEISRLNSHRFAWLNIGFLGLLLYQFALLSYNPISQIPSARERQAAQAIIHRVSRLSGDVLVYHHGFVNYQAGKTSFMHSVPLGDVYAARLRRGTPAFQRKRQVQDMFNRAISQQRFDWVVIDQAEKSWFPYYLYVEPFVEDNGAKYPVTGTSMIPHSLAMKNPVARGGVFPLGEPLLARYFTNGWGNVGEKGRWMQGEAATLMIALERRKDYRLLVEAQPSCPGGVPLAAALRISWNGEPLGVIPFSACQPGLASFPVAQDTLKKELNRLDFNLEGWSGALPSTATVEIIRLELIRR